MKRVVGVLTTALIGCVAVAGHWAAENAALRAELKQLSAQAQHRDHALELAAAVESTPLVMPQSSCALNQPLTTATLKELCADYIKEESQQLAGELADPMSGTLKKYDALLQQTVLSKVELASVSRLLAKRESIANAAIYGYFVDEQELAQRIEKQGEQLSALDNELQSVLSTDAYADYQLLRDSEYEQFQLQEFEAGLQSPLQEQQKGRLLMAKLRSKHDFHSNLESLQGDGLLTSDELRAMVERYKANYYMESAALLQEDAYGNLRAYEDAQFEVLYQSLLGQVTDP